MDVQIFNELSTLARVAAFDSRRQLQLHFPIFFLFLPTIVIPKIRTHDDSLSQKTPQSWTIKSFFVFKRRSALLRGDTKQITALAIRLGRVSRQDSLSREPYQVAFLGDLDVNPKYDVPVNFTWLIKLSDCL